MLLFIQANADLTLPDYRSKIVNIGIQQGSVDSAIPAALRAQMTTAIQQRFSTLGDTLITQMGIEKSGQCAGHSPSQIQSED